MRARYVSSLLILVKPADGPRLGLDRRHDDTGPTGVGIGVVGLGVVLVVALASGAARKLRAALAEIDAELPSRRGE